MKTLLSLFIALSSPVPVHAQGDLPSNIYGAGVDGNGRTLNTPPKPASTPSPAPATTGSGASSSSGATREGSGRSGSSAPSINPGAREGQGSQNSGMGANLAAGAGLIASAIPLLTNKPTIPAGAAMLAMALLAIAQGLAQGDAAGKSGQTASASGYGSLGDYGVGAGDGSGSGSGAGGLASANPEYNKGASAFAKEQTAKAIDALKGAGYSVEKDGLHTPDGKVIPKSAFSSPGAMASAGIDALAVKEATKILANIEKDYAKYNVSGLGVDSGGGGGGGGSSASSSDTEYTSPFSKYKNPFAITDGDKKQLMAGKTVLFDGEPIGVRGRNIFDMIHTAYQTKRTRNDFIEEGAAVRGPASVPSSPGKMSAPKRR